mgnify:CR=1 FL=1
MPQYVYRCSGCEEEFSTFHLMSETISQCNFCNSKEIERIPQLTSKFPSKPPAPVGELVKSFIEETKNDIEEQKKEAARELKK